MSSPWTRRGFMHLALGAGGARYARLGAAQRRRVGIVGGGMAGVSLAWLLDGLRDVTLIEAAPALGGNVQSVSLEVDGSPVVVDIGAQFFHPGPHPTYVRLLGVLGLLREVHSFSSAITLHAAGEANPRFVSPILPGRAWPLLPEWNRAGIEAFAVAFTEAKKREDEDASWDVTLEEWLASLGLAREQWEGMVLPWAASLFSGDIEQARGLSARAAMIFAAKALPENPAEPIPYYVLKPGMGEPIQRMAASFTTVEVSTGTPVTSVARGAAGGFSIAYGDGAVAEVDDLVLASSGPSTLQLLGGLPDTAAQQSALAAMEFRDAQLAVHTDAAYAHANAQYWSFLNSGIEGGHCEASTWMAGVLAGPPPETAAKIWKSWVTNRSEPPAQVLAEARFRHMLPTTGTLRAQNELSPLQGRDGVWIAGGYTRPYDSQETALLSAIEIAKGLTGRSARLQALPGGR